MNAAHQHAHPGAKSAEPKLHFFRWRTGARATARRCLPILVALAALGLPAVAQATTYGADVSSEFSDQHWGISSPAQVEASLQSLYAAGGRVGRADSEWSLTEPNRPSHGRAVFNWSYDDMVMGELAQARLRWQPDLEYTPRWGQAHRSNIVHIAGGTFRVPLPPAKNSTFATYASAFMHRYGPHGAFWRQNHSLPYEPVNALEVWNEPDEKRTWGSKINLGDYAKMYVAVRAAIKRVDRHALVATGGLAWTPSSLPRLLKAFRGKPLDAVAFHPYASTPKRTIAIAKGAISLMRRYGRRRVPLLADEYGWTWTRNTWGTTKRKNVDRYVTQALEGLTKLHLAGILPFSWGNKTWGLSDGNFAKTLAAMHKHSRRK